MNCRHGSHVPALRRHAANGRCVTAPPGNRTFRVGVDDDRLQAQPLSGNTLIGAVAELDMNGPFLYPNAGHIILDQILRFDDTGGGIIDGKPAIAFVVFQDLDFDSVYHSEAFRNLSADRPLRFLGWRWNLLRLARFHIRFSPAFHVYMLGDIEAEFCSFFGLSFVGLSFVEDFFTRIRWKSSDSVICSTLPEFQQQPEGISHIWKADCGGPPESGTKCKFR